MTRNTEEEWTEIYRDCQALWTHDGNPKRPHALLSGGEHSGGIFNSELVMEYPGILDRAASDLIEKLCRAGFDIGTPDRVIGPAMGAITLAHDVARHIGRGRDNPCLRAYAEKQEDGSFAFNRTSIGENEILLSVEDVLTSGESVGRMLMAVPNKANVLGFIGLLVNRSGLVKFGGRKLVALIDHPMPNWPADECPLCKQGSEAIRPKGNWGRLNADY